MHIVDELLGVLWGMSQGLYLTAFGVVARVMSLLLLLLFLINLLLLLLLLLCSSAVLGCVGPRRHLLV